MFWRNKLGWFPNQEDQRDQSFQLLGLPIGTDPGNKLILHGWEPPVYHQGSTNSCVAQAIAAAIEITERQTFGVSETPARRQMYYNSRSMHGAETRDNGTYLRLSGKALFKMGVCSEKHCPFSKRRINQQPSYGAYMRGHGRRGAKYVFLTGRESRRVDEIVSSLRAGYPVLFGTEVTRDYLRNAGPHMVDRPEASDKLVGGHAQLITGVRRDGGSLQFRVRNSWGVNWRDGGHVWMAQEYITWRQSRDFMVFYGWDSIRDNRPSFDLLF